MTAERSEDTRVKHREGGGRFGSLGSIIGLLVCTWAAALASRPLNDNSFFTHLATGRVILEEGGVPTRDPYTFTAAGEPWTVQSWLASAAYAGFERLGGALGLRLLLLIAYLVAAWLLWRLTRPAASLVVRIALVSSALLVANGLWTERPYMVGVIGVALVLLALDEELPWWSLVPVMWVWGNSHGSFVLAPVLVVLVVLGAALDRGRRWSEVPRHERLVVAAVVGGSLLAAIGPLGLRVLTFPLVAAERSDVFRHVTEWQAPTFRSPSELAYLVFAVGVLASLARWGRSWRLIVPTAAFVAASLYAQRNIVMAVVVLVGAGARTVPAVGTLRSEDRPAFGAHVGAVVAALALLIAAAALVTPVSGIDDYAARPLAWVHGTSLADVRIATDVLDGNLLEVLDGPTGTVFIDDRFDLMPADVFEDFLVLRGGHSGWHEVLGRWKIDAVVWRTSAPLASLLRLSQDWRIVYSDNMWVVASRRRVDSPPADR